MKTDWSQIEPFRLQIPPYLSGVGDTFGMFAFAFAAKVIRCIAVDGAETGWEHVSVTVAIGKKCRMPTWEDMSYVKDRFWEKDEAVAQFHPPESEYVNNHAFCLHLWKCVWQPFPLPPSILTGVKSLGTIFK